MSSSGQTGATGSWFRRLANSITGEPRDLDELAAILVEARERGLIDADVLQMLESVLEVSEIQVRDIMVPRSQMVVINREDPAGDGGGAGVVVDRGERERACAGFRQSAGAADGAAGLGQQLGGGKQGKNKKTARHSSEDLLASCYHRR